MTAWNSEASTSGGIGASRLEFGVAPRRVVRVCLAGMVGLLVANCANQPQRSSGSSGSREVGAFSDVNKYGRASPRVVADGAEVPKGGGRYHVGNAYSIAGRTYYPSDRPVGHSQTGMASWYGEAFHGRKTANGEVYDKRSYTAAHPTMPLPSYARVTNLRNGNSIIVRVNDRGPYHGGRAMDVSERVAHALDFKGQGTTRVRIDYLGKAGLGGSDDTRLAASLRTDGAPASSPGIPASIGGGTVMVASNEPVLRTPATPRPAVAMTQPVSRPAVQATPAPSIEEDAEETAAPVARALAYQPTQGTPAKGIPVPLSRPFDLGTIPGATTPVRATTSPARPQRTASLSFAPNATGLSSFQKGNPLADLPPAKFTQTVARMAKAAPTP
jgi:rare lipoprotein A